MAESAAIRIPTAPLEYVTKGAGLGLTLRRNIEAAESLEAVTRVGVEIADVDMSTTLYGTLASLPLIISPMGLLRVVHPEEGELALARAASKANIPFILSMVSTTSLEDVMSVAPNTWLQFQPTNDSVGDWDLLERADSLDVKGLVVTVDFAGLGVRPSDIKNGLTIPPTPSDNVLPNHLMYWHRLDSSPKIETRMLPSRDTVAEVTDTFLRGVSDQMFMAIRDKWGDRPLLVKGVLSASRAKRYMKLGADGIIVSNHGGRQYDNGFGTLRALPSVAAAVHAMGGTVIVDGGIRTGAQMALAATFADFVGIGRSAAVGLAAYGEAGATRMFDLFATEFHAQMSHLGARRIDELRHADGEPFVRLPPGFEIREPTSHRAPSLSTLAHPFRR
jgi:isopentenyl diphosphate isomerase/L-lactate dehydrogenase-like FMN-dependent dehydrogenase